MNDMSADRLLSFSSAKILEWLDGDGEAAEDFNFDALAFGAHQRATSNDSLAVSERLGYAKVAVEAWSRARRAGRGAESWHESLPSELLMRSELLRRLDVGLDPMFGASPFFELLEQSVSIVDSESRRGWVGSPLALQDTEKATLLGLRRIKNLMRSVSLLLEGNDGRALPRTAWWWERRGVLP